MIKKILLWGLYAGFAGVLVIGAINRTNARSGDVTQAQNGNGRGQVEYPDSADANSTGYQGGRDETDTQQGNGQNDDRQANGQPLAAQEEHAWLTLTGAVTGAAADLIMVTTSSGEMIEIAGRPWSFAQESGFNVQAGDQVELYGFYENGIFEVAAINDITSGASVQIRDEVGRPLWAGGRGRGNR